MERIEKVELFPVTTTRLYGEPSQHVLLCITSESGMEGWGEVSDVSHLPALMPDTNDLEVVLQELLRGRDVMGTSAIESAMLANFPGGRFHGKACLVRAGVSIAIHDLKAKLLGISVADLLGGKNRRSIPICYPIFRMKSVADVEDRKHLVRTQYEKGFTAFRLYFGTATDADEELLDWIGSEYRGRVTMTSLDGSGLFKLPQFLRIYERLKHYDFESIESPVDRDDVDMIAEARRRIQHPVSEHVRSLEYATRLIRQHAVDIFNISITVAGGIDGMVKLFHVAEAANLECLIGTTQELSVATAAQAHVGAAVKSLDYASDPVGPELYEQDIVEKRVVFRDGELEVPDGPGLGVKVLRSKIKEISTPLSARNDVKTEYSRG